MPKPNVDGPHLVVGGVKYYPKQHDTPLSESHEELLRSPLINIEILEGTSPFKTRIDE